MNPNDIIFVNDTPKEETLDDLIRELENLFIMRAAMLEDFRVVCDTPPVMKPVKAQYWHAPKKKVVAPKAARVMADPSGLIGQWHDIGKSPSFLDASRKWK